MSLTELLQLFAAIGCLVAGVWALLKIIFWQFEKRLDERFATQEKARREASETWAARFSVLEAANGVRERELLMLRAELPRDYVRREDHIRFETAIHGKLDALNAKLDLIAERSKKGG